MRMTSVLLRLCATRFALAEPFPSKIAAGLGGAALAMTAVLGVATGFVAAFGPDCTIGDPRCPSSEWGRAAIGLGVSGAVLFGTGIALVYVGSRRAQRFELTNGLRVRF